MWSSRLNRIVSGAWHPKTEHTFLTWVDKKKFKSTKTGRQVRFRSLPLSEQQKIRNQWVHEYGKAAHKNEIGVDFKSYLIELKRHLRDQLGGRHVSNLEHDVDEEGEYIGLDFTDSTGKDHSVYVIHRGASGHKVEVRDEETGKRKVLDLKGHKDPEGAITDAVAWVTGKKELNVQSGHKGGTQPNDGWKTIPSRKDGQQFTESHKGDHYISHEKDGYYLYHRPKGTAGEGDYLSKSMDLERLKDLARQDVKNRNKKPTSNLINALEKHDWEFESSSGRNYYSGKNERDWIRNALSELPEDQARKIFEKHAPKHISFDTYYQKQPRIGSLKSTILSVVNHAWMHGVIESPKDLIEDDEDDGVDGSPLTGVRPPPDDVIRDYHKGLRPKPIQ